MTENEPVTNPVTDSETAEKAAKALEASEVGTEAERPRPSKRHPKAVRLRRSQGTNTLYAELSNGQFRRVEATEDGRVMPIRRKRMSKKERRRLRRAAR